MLQAMCLSWLPGREGVKQLLPFYTISRVISTTMMWALFATTIISFNFPEVSMGYKILPAVLWSTGILCEFLVTPWLSARGYKWPVHMHSTLTVGIIGHVHYFFPLTIYGHADLVEGILYLGMIFLLHLCLLCSAQLVVSLKSSQILHLQIVMASAHWCSNLSIFGTFSTFTAILTMGVLALATFLFIQTFNKVVRPLLVLAHPRYVTGIFRDVKGYTSFLAPSIHFMVGPKIIFTLLLFSVSAVRAMGDDSSV